MLQYKSNLSQKMFYSFVFGIVLGLSPQIMASDNTNNNSGAPPLDLSAPVGDPGTTGVEDPLLDRLKALVAKGKSRNSSELLQDSEIREMKILINRYGLTQLGIDKILTRQEWKTILQNRAQQQRALWRQLAPQDGMNDIRLTASQRYNKCVMRSQADYFMNLEEDAMEHRNGMSDIFTDNTLPDPTRKTKLKELNRRTAAKKSTSRGAYSTNVRSCKAWVAQYNAWLKKHEATLKQGRQPTEVQPIFNLQTR